MALLKIYTKAENKPELFDHVAETVKFIGAAALNVPEVPTSPASVETVFVEAIDIIGIDYIIEIIAVERPNQQQIAENLIAGLNRVYPDKLFSVYFNTISERGMANTPRDGSQSEEPINMEQAIARCRR